MSITITQLAEELNVSHSMVSRVLNGRIKGVVKQETAERILALAKARGYVPNTSARTLKTGKSGRIGLVIGGISSRWSGCYAQALLNEAEANGYRLVISTTNYNQQQEQSALEDLLSFNVDGILYPLFLDEDSAIAKKLQKRNYPLLTDNASGNFSQVHKEYEAAYDSMLAEFSHRGFQRVTLLTWDYDSNAVAFEQCAAKYGLAVEKVFFDASDRDNEKPFRRIADMNTQAFYTQSPEELRNYLNFCEENEIAKPQCACVYTMPFEYFRDPAVIGAIALSLKELVRQEVKILLDTIRSGRQTLKLQTAKFMLRNEWKTLWETQKADKWYQHYR